MNELIEWPDIRLKNNAQMGADDKSPSDFISWILENKQKFEKCMADLSQVLISEDSKNWVQLLSDWCKINHLNYDEDIVTTLFCAEILHRHPEIDTWISVREIMRNSSAVEYWLKNAMLAQCSTNPVVKNIYASLISNIFCLIDSGKLLSPRQAEIMEQLSYWNQSSRKLEEIWRGFRFTDPRFFAESGLFSVLAEIDFASLVKLLNSSSNPILIDSVLMLSGAGLFSPRLSRWKDFAQSAADAFSEDGSWNGNILLPMLLAHVCERLKDLPYQLLRQGKMIEDLYKEELEQLTEYIANTLSVRSDFTGIVTRWSAWLMRNVILSDQDSQDFKKPDFVFPILNDALGRHSSKLNLPETSPTDASDWEVLCYFSARSNFAHSKNYKLQSISTFEKIWQRDGNNFSAEHNLKLDSLLSLHFRREGQSFPGHSAHFFAYPLVQCSNTAEHWLSLWNSAYFLREIAEFGLADTPSERYSLRHNIGEFLLILCTTGIAALDQMAGLYENGESRDLQILLNLHKHLHFAVMEMMSIDDTINTKHWKELYLHLCLRRVIWDSSLMSESQLSLFPSDEKPDFRDYLAYYHSDIKELVGMLSSAIINGANPSEVKRNIQEAGIELHIIISQLKEFNRLDENRYPLDVNAIEKLDPLL
jgi:hypothetical protein